MLSLGVGESFPWDAAVMVVVAFVTSQGFLICSLRSAGASAGALVALARGINYLLNFFWAEALLKMLLS